MKKIIFISSLVLGIIFGFSLNTSAQNLVVNGDMETWTGGLPDGWTKAENIVEENTIVHGDDASAKHTSDETTKDLQQDINGIQAGNEYTIGYWYFDNDPMARTRIWAYWLSGGSTLPENAEELRPSDYSEDNANWQEFNVVLTAPAGADGFRFEVRVYKQDATWGGAVYYDDFLFSGDIVVDPEPSNYPTSFDAEALGSAINLTWDDATGAQLPSAYLLYASTNSSLPVPVDGTMIANDPDLSDGSGALNVNFGIEAAAFSGLEPSTTYYFSIYPYTNSGSSIDYKNDGSAPTANATTSNNVTVVIEYENFDDSWGAWTTISVIGDQVWDRDNTYGIGGTPCAAMSGYDGAPFENEDWLISPAMNFDDYENESMNFFSAMNYTGPDLELKASTNYSGSGDPNAATWTDLSFIMPPGGSWDYVESGIIDLSSFSGTAVYVAFKFTSTTAGSATWELDEITINGEEEATIDPEPSNYPTAFFAVEAGSAIDLEWTDASGTQLPDAYIIYAGTNSSLPSPVDGTPVENDTDLSDGNGAMNITFGEEMYTFAGLEPATVYYFTIYPYTNSGINIDYKTDGTAPSAEATTSNIVTVVIEYENFDDSWGGWTPVSVIGDQVWERDNTFGIGGTPCASMSGYDGAPFENEDWLISPAMNFDDYENESMNFFSAMNYTGPDLELKASTNYSGSGDPNAATWTDLSFILPPGGSWDFVESGIVDLSTFSGTAVYVAFKFTSTTAGSATWELDEITISGEEIAGIDPEPTNYPTAFDAVPSNTSVTVNWTDATGAQLPSAYIIYAGTSDALPSPVDGTPVANDPDLSDGSGAFNVAFGNETALFDNLDLNTTYHFSIYPYTNSGINIDYKTDGTAPTAEATTLLIPEPTNYPTDFVAVANTGIIELSWTDAIGTQLPEAYVVFASNSSTLPSPVDGTPIADDPDLTDGNAVVNVMFGMEELSFGGLDDGVTYYFSIYPYTNSGSDINYKTDGTVPAAEATMPIGQSIIEEENFDVSWGNWTTISVAGDQVWDRDNTWGIGDTPCASVTGYDGQPYANDDWLISPPLNFDSYDNEAINFMNALGYTGEVLKLKVSTDYDGGNDPYSATWTDEDYTMSDGFFEWTESGEVDLSGYNGNAVYIAFQFTSTDAESATWEVDDIVITGDLDIGTDELEELNAISVYPNPASDFVIIDQGNNSTLKIQSINGQLIKEIQMNAGSNRLDISELKDGVYILMFTNKTTGNTQIKKLLVK
jgi:hypothetical protein